MRHKLSVMTFACFVIACPAGTIFQTWDEMDGWTIRREVAGGRVDRVQDLVFGGYYLDTNIIRTTSPTGAITAIYTLLGPDSIPSGTIAANIPEMWMQFDFMGRGGSSSAAYCVGIGIFNANCNNISNSNLNFLGINQGHNARTLGRRVINASETYSDALFSGSGVAAYRVKAHLYHNAAGDLLMDIGMIGYNSDGVQVYDAGSVTGWTVLAAGAILDRGMNAFGIKNWRGSDHNNEIDYDNLYFSTIGDYESTHGGNSAPMASWIGEPPEPEVPVSLNMNQFPYGRFFENMGQVCMSSGFGPEDTYGLFVVGRDETEANHSHYATLHFMIYSRGGFGCLDSGTRYNEDHNMAHMKNYYCQTVAHNTLLINQPGEPPVKFWGRTADVMDGGQHRIAGGRLKAFESTSYYVYAAADATACYHHGGGLPEKVSLVTRQLVYLPPDHFVIFDRVTSTHPSYPKRWLLHTVNEPQIDGDVFYNDHKGVRLFCKTLLPQGAVLTAVGGPGYEFYSAGQNWPIAGEANISAEARETMGRWRVEVSPPTEQLSDYFLHVLQAGDLSLALMDEATLIQNPTEAGVVLSLPANTWTLTFSKTGELGGHIRCQGNNNFETPLSTYVQSQIGTTAGTRKIGDLTMDGYVDIDDLIILLDQWLLI